MYKRTGHGLNPAAIFFCCPIPVSMDIYPLCTFNCKYCFGKASISKKNRTTLKSPNPETLDNFLKKYSSEKQSLPNYTEDQFLKWYVNNRKCIQIGVVSDPFDYQEHKLGYTYDILKVFDKYHYPIRISTKGILYSNKKYLKLFRNNKKYWKLGVSLFTKNENLLNKVEPQGFSYKKRLKALKKAVKEGIDVVIRFGPYIPGINEDYEEIITDLHNIGIKDFQFRAFEKSTFLTPAEKKNYEELIKISTINLEKYIKKYIGRERTGELSYLQSAKQAQKIKKITDRYNMNFYIQNDPARCWGKSEICCGVKKEYTLQDYNLASALFYAKKNGRVSYDDIGKNFNAILGEINTENTCYFSSKIKFPKLKNLFLNNWNNINSKSGLVKRFGYHLIPVAKDKNNNLIYEFDKSRLKNPSPKTTNKKEGN